MNKEGLMFGVLGLVVGLVIGFVGANNINRTSAVKPVPSAAPAVTSGDTQNLPPDHPPIGSTSTPSGGDKPPTVPMPQVTEAVEKAKQQPQNYEAQMTAADLYYQIRRFDDAAKIYEIAIKLEPNEVEPLIKAGNAYFDAAEEAANKNDEKVVNERFALAEKLYLKALQKNPNDINLRTDLGLTFFLRSPRDIDRAIKEYKTSLAVDPNHEITLQNLALAYTENGDKDSLLKTLDALRKVNPNNPVIQKATEK